MRFSRSLRGTFSTKMLYSRERFKVWINMAQVVLEVVLGPNQ